MVVKDRQLHREIRSGRCLTGVLRASTDSTETDRNPNPVAKDTQAIEQPSTEDTNQTSTKATDQSSKETTSSSSGAQIGTVAARPPRKRLDELQEGYVLDGIVVRWWSLMGCGFEMWSCRKMWSSMDALWMRIVWWMSLCTSLTLGWVRHVYRARTRICCRTFMHEHHRIMLNAGRRSNWS